MSASADVSLSKGSQPKSKRSFIARLPSFRKKKHTPAKESELDMHLRSAEEDLNGGVKIRPPSQVKNRKDDNVKRKSKTSSIVASYEKRLSDLKDEESRTNGKKNGNGKTSPVDNGGKQSPQGGATTTTTQKSSRFGFGFAWQKISSFENGSGKKTESKKQRDELNANIQQARGNIKSLSLDLELPHGSPPDRESTSSVKTPESDRSSCSSNSSFKVYGQPMLYKSVFSDEPRGLKRQASSSQSEGFNSSGISLSSSTSPLHDKLRTAGSAATHVDNSESISRLTQMNRTFSKEDSGGGVNPSIHDRTYPIEESPTCIVNTTFKLEPGDYSAENTGTSVEQELPQSSPGVVRKENSISCARDPPISTAVVKDGDAPCESGSQSRALDKVTLLRQDVSRPSAASPAQDIPKEINPLFACIKNTDPLVSPRHRPTSNTMGAVQSSADAFSTPARPVELPLHLRNPHISAIKHCSESLDSCELDSLCSEDLMCDSRYLDDDMFDTRDESCHLSRSLSVEETAAMHRAQLGWSGRARAVSVDQLPTNSSLEKRVGVTRGLAPSPLGLPPGRRGGSRNYPAHPVPDEGCQSPVEELQFLINSSSYRDSDRNKNGNANSSSTTRVRSQSGGNNHPLRPPRWPSFPPEEEGMVMVDAVVYRHMIQDMTSVKTMLFKLKRALQAVDNTSSPFEQALLSPCVSPLTSPMSEDNPIQEVIIDDLKEENHVLRKEVKNLQELLADTQHNLKELQLQKNVHTSAEQQDASTQCVILTQDQSLQVFIKPHRCDSPEKLSNMTSRHNSPLKVGLSPTSPEPPTDLANHIQYMETSPPGGRRRPRSVEAPSSSQLSPTRRRPQSAEGPSSDRGSPDGRGSPESGRTSKRSQKSKSKIPSSPTRGDNMIIEPAAPQNPGRYMYDEPSEISKNAEASVIGKGKPPTGGSQSKKLTGSKKSQSKLARPSSYKSKGSGSQDSLQSDGSLTDDGRQPTEERRGGPLKRPLVYSQQPKSAMSSPKPPTGRQEIQQKNMNGSSDGLSKPKEIRMMAVRQQSGKSLLQKGTQNQDTSSQDDQRDNGSLSTKLPSLLRMSKTPQTKQQEIPTNHRGLTNRPPQLIDANSNPVPQQNGVSHKTSTRTAVEEQSDSQLKSMPVQIPCGIKQLPVSANSCLSQSPERASSGEDEKPSPPPSPRSRGQQSSKIALPVRGRGSSRLPRGKGIPTRRTNNS
ncbi:uncharacterized protein LOC117303702 isoform X2 [Asterias rubens]|uniref:uncharacterized protein LOC117303702 isoform X2 n=1 Tax=Asterias rubens TaxID=7604 RepID=UPI001455A0B8|nr:uncharacterized protein LOC117303702 isoform X2 [Asterias rubens]